MTWLADVDEDRVFLSVVTLAELRYGIDRLKAGARKRQLDAWVREDLRFRFEGRIIPVSEAVADAWGTIVAASEVTGRAMGAMDALLAATARVHDLTVVTRDTADFDRTGVLVANPWHKEES